MKKTEILQKDAPLLRKVAKPVPLKDVGSKKLNTLIEKMKKALHGEQDGVAIAAPQVGESLRMFVVSGKAVAWSKKSRTIEDRKKSRDQIFINPEIIKSSKKKRRVEEGCLSVRWLYGKVSRSDKVTIRAYDEHGKLFERGASGLMAQIFQHETDHLNGVLFIDNAVDIHDMPPTNEIRYVFFGSSDFSYYVLEELENLGLTPILHVDSTKNMPSIEELRELEADVFVVASFGKILSDELINLPKYKSLNVHPSLLPKWRGPAPIQNTILSGETPGVTIIKMDQEMDHGPILAQASVPIQPWPDHYRNVEEKLGRAGGKILGIVLPKWIKGEVLEKKQDESGVSFSKLVVKEDGLIDLNGDAESNWKKVLAYSTWPGAHMIYKNKNNKEIRVVIKDAKLDEGKFVPTRVIPAGKREMPWQDFLRGN